MKLARISFFVLITLIMTIWLLNSFEGPSASSHPLDLPPDLKVLISPTLKDGEYTITYVTRREIIISRKPMGTHAATFGHPWQMYLPVRQIEELKAHFTNFREQVTLSKDHRLLSGVKKPMGEIGLYGSIGLGIKEFSHVHDDTLTGCETFKLLFRTPDRLVFDADKGGYASGGFHMSVNDTSNLEKLLDKLPDFRDRFISENQERLKERDRALNVLDKK